MNRLLISLAVVSALAGIAAGVHHHGVAAGRAEVQAAWDDDKRMRAQAANSAILARIKNNERLAEQQAATNQVIKKDYQNEIAAVTAVARPVRMRVPAANCARSAAAAEAESTGGGDAAVAGAIELPEPLAQSLWQLANDADRIVAHCRAAQEFIAANGMAP